MRNPVAHLTCANHTNCLDFHHVILIHVSQRGKLWGILFADASPSRLSSWIMILSRLDLVQKEN